MAIGHLRGRMPVLAFILLAVVCLALIGFACACLVDQIAQAVDRTPGAVIELWPQLAIAALVSLSGITLAVRASSRASPASLQRFLF